MHIDSSLLYDIVRRRIQSVRTAEVETRLSQAELGEVLGVMRSTVANIETGTQQPSLHHVYEVCAHFNLELADLLPGVDELRRRSAAVRALGLDPALSAVLDKLKQGG